MELLQLRYFRKVAEMENVSKAARALYVSQPALSTAIGRLEKELGFSLFERRGNRIFLTEAGRCLLEYVNSVFSTLDEGIDKAKQIAFSNSETLKVASGFGVIRGIAEDYQKKYPGRMVEVSCLDTERIYEKLAAREADIGLNRGPIQDKRFLNRTLMTGRYYIAVNKNHPYHSRKSIRLKELEGELLFCSNLAGTYEHAMNIFKGAGVTPNLLMLDERKVLFSAVEKGLGSVFFMPLFVERTGARRIRKVRGTKFVFFPLRTAIQSAR